MAPHMSKAMLPGSGTLATRKPKMLSDDTGLHLSSLSDEGIIQR